MGGRTVVPVSLRPRRAPRIAPWLVALSLSLGAVAASADESSWQAAPAEPADWHLPESWTQGVPGAETSAVIDNGGIASIDAGLALAEALEISGPVPGAVEQSGGECRVGRLSVYHGRYAIDAGRLESTYIVVDDRPARAEWPVGEPVLFDPLWIATPATSVDPRPVEPSKAGSDPIVPSPNGLLLQTGGQVHALESLHIGGGHYELAGGVVEAPRLVIDARAPSGMSQTGSSSTEVEQAWLQDGLFVFAGGWLDLGEFRVGDPGGPIVSNSSVLRSPAFVQLGGQSRIAGNLELCAPAVFSPLRFESVRYSHDGGELFVGGDLVVGTLGIAPASFDHSGGSIDVSGMLRIEGRGSDFALGAADLAVGRLAVGIGTFNVGGSLRLVDPTARIHVAEAIVLGPESDLAVVAGASLHLTGDRFEVHGIDASRLRGLGQLHVSVEGGDAGVTTLEVAGLDLGDSPEGWIDNFALGTLEVGGDTPALARLVDDFDNQPDTVDSEALYVDRLVVHEGSTLDVGSFSVYYQHAEIAGSVSPGMGRMVQVVPEPQRWLLAAAALLSLWTLRRVGRK